MYSSTWKTLIFKRYNGACIKISHGKLRNEAVINVKKWQNMAIINARKNSFTGKNMTEVSTFI